MNCPEYQELPHNEKMTNIGELVHLYQNDSGFHQWFTAALEVAREKGHFDKVEIMPVFNVSPQLETEINQ